jgi:4-amino-4-deoxy-L-arabinose transferase-like glycosyltransferase
VTVLGDPIFLVSRISPASHWPAKMGQRTRSCAVQRLTAPSSMSSQAATRSALLALAVWLLVTLPLRPLMLPDEGRYVGVAFAMTHGDLLTPLLHGLPYFHKPPLMYWIDAAAMQVFGVNEFAGRIAPALGAWLMGAALFIDLRRRVGLREALIALGVLASCPFFFIGGQFANLDMLVAGLLTLSILCAARAVDESDGAAALRWVVAAWCAAALSVLAKGLIGVVLPALVLGPWLAAQRRWSGFVRLLHPLALLAFVLIAAPWFVAMQSRYPGFLDYFFMEQHVRRFARAGFNNMQPFWFFVPVLALVTLPWSLWLPALARWRTWPAGMPSGLYAWWALVVVVFFSLPASKLVGYVLPALAPLAALLALSVSCGRAWRWVMPAAAAGCVALVLGLALRDAGSHRHMALELRARMQPGDRVVFIGEPFFDVPFYARLSTPPIVVADWDDPAITTHDDWRKELRDAARFDPARGRELLLRPDQAASLRCDRRTVWYLAGAAWQPPATFGPLEPVVADRHASLWRSATSRTPCS